ncbi:ATPase [Mesomycoplasma conjunctivae]|uniref:ATP-dependent serine proteinase, heat shock pr n=1 Tax=Mesomycoplasma conjunctivae (strain ATCC 25834 / NCTC 10147 / HRC/581) TaxID=572263 RepID=C5J5N6_MESCH|nr:AAA family ATPase [Mesomycoplasma conjunctivae]CAT04759.1 ATP-dependent serine proteinase, heat shock pr [Mesomycoplasma conjunctivae]VEU65781.1 ATPase [Mesomycoplasma conjunctivae]
MNDKFKNLNKYGRNLTQLAKENKLEPVINRDEEIRRIIKILSRKTKNNPVLVGEPGVGKSAIVEGMAFKIIQNQVPQNLKNKQIFELDIASIIAGASFKGEFEKRIKEILKEVEANKDEVIIFVDEIHLLIGTGSSGTDSMDFANILKPAMARGQIKLIGATTNNEYRLYIEKDSALERRMQKVIIEEPSTSDAITILRGIKERFENFHKVKITDDALIAAVKLSNRFINDRFLPDKAIDLIDEACANIKVQMNFQPEELEKKIQKLTYLKMEKISLENEANLPKIEAINQQISQLEQEINKLQSLWSQEKQRAEESGHIAQQIDDLKNLLNQQIANGEYQNASKIKYLQIPSLETQLQKLKENKSSLVNDIVDQNEIAAVVAKMTKIPLEKLIEDEAEKLLHLESRIKQEVRGQDLAISLVSDAILRFKANINDINRPIGSFLFLGPTGVGKTELARSLAKQIFDNSEQIIRLDMSEFMEKHSVSKLIGAPPGYIGFEQGGILTEKVRLNPYSIVLLDEIEKAHPDVINILLQILDSGWLTDSKGKKINFKNTIIIMTSNIAAQKILANQKLDEQTIKKELLQFFKPEFINRIDEIVTFNKLSKQVVEQIIDLELAKLALRIQENNIMINFDNSIKKWILQSAYDQNYGARPIKRFIKQNLETKIAKFIITKQINVNDSYQISYKNEDILVNKQIN